MGTSLAKIRSMLVKQMSGNKSKVNLIVLIVKFDL
jgi:hypothetical protein